MLNHLPVAVSLDTDNLTRVTDKMLSVTGTQATNTRLSNPKRDTECVCIICQTRFPVKRRIGTKTCSAKCRSRLRRLRDRARRKTEMIMWMIGDIQDMLDSPDPLMVKRARQALAEIREQSTAACAEVGIK